MEKSLLERFSKIVSIAGELYEDNPKYFIDCFFNAYYQVKKKKVVDEKCNGDPELISRVWDALNLFKHLVNDQKEDPGKAFNISYRKYGINKHLFQSILNSFKAYKSSKSTKFKGLF